jgi:NAD(P)-dependent dehydrogenase (short-subunit alcohol dehydrogenase family)
MKLADKVVVITGGASGIGRALAGRILAERPAGICLLDLDRDRVLDVADELGQGTIGIGCDVADETALGDALVRATGVFGPVDAFFANAGVLIGGDEQTPDEAWDRAFAVNVHAHVLAARLLVPDWLERGAGCFVSTASAAGLLTQLGGAPYAVTKHAAVAFAEWLAATYGDRGIHVSCLCPLGVQTAMLASAQEMEASSDLASAGLASVLASADVLSAEAVADAVIAGLDAERFLILPHPEVHEYLQRKAADPDRWLAGMQRLRRAGEAGG